ncbi:hypothetical protein [Endozoicomonas montiporae]|uniref:Uncharacterized protein n=1 Tax=Endozoicomonas montiporae CL-33 TaxID=570277 RepID=A0A142B9F1_9GAMM|nr:hypothetical protein [Endozoicomonas montiporae]AMO55377.1 hypothetical protein EZMO1_1182 [Endozoicomonas montiporae CL-33]
MSINEFVMEVKPQLTSDFGPKIQEKYTDWPEDYPYQMNPKLRPK